MIRPVYEWWRITHLWGCLRTEARVVKSWYGLGVIAWTLTESCVLTSKFASHSQVFVLIRLMLWLAWFRHGIHWMDAGMLAKLHVLTSGFASGSQLFSLCLAYVVTRSHYVDSELSNLEPYWTLTPIVGWRNCTLYNLLLMGGVPSIPRAAFPRQG